MTGNTKQEPGLHHVCVYAADIDTGLRFYTKGLGFVVRHEWSKVIGTECYKFKLVAVKSIRLINCAVRLEP